eukprot:COSAG05_NODE_3381_length_2097_cov_1.745746_4_plen_73_part_00
MSDAVSVEKAAVDEQERRLQEAQLKLDGLTKVDKVAASVLCWTQIVVTTALLAGHLQKFGRPARIASTNGES